MSQCACGCKRSLEGMRLGARYASAACRTRDWKSREGITGIRYVKASQNAKSKPSGKQMNPTRALKGAALMLSTFAEAVGHPIDDGVADMAAHLFLSNAYPVRQRERLQAKSKEPQTLGERRAA